MFWSLATAALAALAVHTPRGLRHLARGVAAGEEVRDRACPSRPDGRRRSALSAAVVAVEAAVELVGGGIEAVVTRVVREVAAVACARQADVREARLLVVAVAAVVVGDGQPPLRVERGPLPELVAAVVGAARVVGSLRTSVVRAGERLAAVGRAADRRCRCCRRPAILDARRSSALERVRVEALRHASVALVGVAVDVGPEGDEDLAAGRAGSPRPTGSSPHGRSSSASRPSRARTRMPAVLALVGLAVGQVVVVGDLHRRREVLPPSVDLASRTWARLSIAGRRWRLAAAIAALLVAFAAGALAGHVVVGPDDVEGAVGAGERLRELSSSLQRALRRRHAERRSSTAALSALTSFGALKPRRSHASRRS